MLRLGGILSIAYVAFFLYCVLDVVRSEPAEVRNLPKPAWLLVVLFVPLVGALAWLLAGRATPVTAGSRSRSRVSNDHPSVRDRRPPPKGPDDDPAFLRRLDEQLRRQRQDGEESQDD